MKLVYIRNSLEDIIFTILFQRAAEKSDSSCGNELCAFVIITYMWYVLEFIDPFSEKNYDPIQ